MGRFSVWFGAVLIIGLAVLGIYQTTLPGSSLAGAAIAEVPISQEIVSCVNDCIDDCARPGNESPCLENAGQNTGPQDEAVTEMNR